MRAMTEAEAKQTEAPGAEARVKPLRLRAAEKKAIQAAEKGKARPSQAASTFNLFTTD